MSITRQITDADLPMLHALLNDVFRTRQNVFDQDVFTDFPLVFVPDNFRNCRILLVNETIVSHAAIFPCKLVVGSAMLKVGVIVLVATHPEFRQRGYAARLMRELQQNLHDDDYDLGILWTGVPEFYRKLGWEVVTPRGWMIDDVGDLLPTIHELSSTNASGTIESFDVRRHLDGVMTLHDREPVRVIRSREEYAALLTLPKIHVWVLVRDEQVFAYLVVATAINKRGLIECGGSADEVLALANHVIHKRDVNCELPLLIYHIHDDLHNRLRSAGVSFLPLECSKGRGCEMIYIVQPDRLPSGFRDDLFIWGLDFT